MGVSHEAEKTKTSFTSSLKDQMILERDKSKIIMVIPPFFIACDHRRVEVQIMYI